MKVELDAKKSQSAQLQAKYVENQAIADNLPKFQEEVNLLKNQLREAIALLPNEANVHTLYRQLFIEAEKSNIEMLSFKPGGSSKKGFYSDLSLDVTLRGSYHRLAEFIDRTGKLDRIINISNIVFTKLTPSNNETETEVSARVTTYMFGGGRRLSI
ncbi:MAG: type 4a pilus biogenesis protein PilO [Bdellovibrionota bacterium]